MWRGGNRMTLESEIDNQRKRIIDLENHVARLYAEIKLLKEE